MSCKILMAYLLDADADATIATIMHHPYNFHRIACQFSVVQGLCSLFVECFIIHTVGIRLYQNIIARYCTEQQAVVKLQASLFIIMCTLHALKPFFFFNLLLLAEAITHLTLSSWHWFFF